MIDICYFNILECLLKTVQFPGAICLIIPAKWYSGGKGLDKFREEMLGDRHISTLVDYSNSLDVFPNVDVAGGVCFPMIISMFLSAIVTPPFFLLH